MGSRSGERRIFNVVKRSPSRPNIVRILQESPAFKIGTSDHLERQVIGILVTGFADAAMFDTDNPGDPLGRKTI